MVKNGHVEIRAVSYAPPTPAAAGVEVVSIAELRHRMRGQQSADRAQRPDFHLLMHVTRGRSWHMVDFHDYGVVPGAWLWIRPGQVQRFGSLEALSGHVVMFPPGTLDTAVAHAAGLDEPVGAALWSPTGAVAARLSEALEHLRHEYAADDLPMATRAAILRDLLAVLVLRLAELPGAGPASPTSTPDGFEVFSRFRAAVETDFAEHRDVTHYARRLGYSQRTLTRAAQAAAGVGAKEYLDNRVVLEAKRLLAHEDDPVATIASRLAFPDASNFVKYFAQRVGETPAVFRARFRSGDERRIR